MHLLFTQSVLGPSIAHPQPAVTGTQAFWGPYLYPSLFISACVYSYLSACLFFPPCVLFRFILTFLTRLFPLFFHLSNSFFFCLSLSLTPFRPYSPPSVFLISFLLSSLYVRLFIITLFLSLFLFSADCDFHFV
jgi:hypothetical protein